MRRSSILATLAVLSASMSAGALYLMKDPSSHFERRRQGISQIVTGTPESLDSSIVQTVRVTDSSGLAVDLTLRRHVADSTGRLPLAVVLGGHVRGKDAVRLVGDTRGIMVAAVSYPFDGDVRPSKATFFRQIPRIRAAFLDTPPALQLALDYLHQRKDVETSRIEAIGVSLGAPFVTIAGALDGRFSRVWAIHGSGGSYAPLEASMRQTIAFAPLRKVAAAAASVIIGGPSLAPERWVNRISPRPFVMVNALEDERMPRQSVDALYASAAQPKELIWMDGRHVHGDAPTIQRLVAIVLERARAGANY